MNPLSLLKGAKFFVIGAVAFAALMLLKTCENNRVVAQNAVIVANAEKVSAQANAAAQQVANQQLEAITSAYELAVEEMLEAQARTEEQFVQIQITQNEQTKVLDSNRLEALVKGKRSLIKLRMNRATQERFDEVEDIFNTP